MIQASSRHAASKVTQTRKYPALGEPKPAKRKVVGTYHMSARSGIVIDLYSIPNLK